MTTDRRRWAVALVVASCLVAAACGSSEDDSATSGDGGGTSTTAGATTSTGDDAAGDDSSTTAPEAAPLPEGVAGFSSAVYADPVNWVCRPDVADDACDVDLTTTIGSLDGASEVVTPERAGDDAVDCFYVYPTVNFEGSRDDAMSADMVAEVNVVNAQLAQFGQVCRLWAPLYRQLTLGGFGNEDDRAVAYGDVRDAFFHWLANDSDGRPFVVIGHSQGTGHLATVLAEEVADEPALRDRLISALMLGGRTDIAPGDPSSSSAGLPLCASSTDTGCVIAFNAVSPAVTEADLGRWGGAPEGRQRACTNPADPATPVETWAPVDTIIPVGEGEVGLENVTTPFAGLDQVLEVRCTVRGAASVLEVRQREGWTGGELTRLTTDVPGWGLHIVEVNLVEGSLVELLGAQIEAFGS